MKPVIFTDLAKDWPATHKWTFDWLRMNHGNIDVPLFDNNFHKTDSFFQPAKTMKFGAFLTLIINGPTHFRIFLLKVGAGYFFYDFVFFGLVIRYQYFRISSINQKIIKFLLKFKR